MVDVPRIDVRASLDEYPRDLHGRRDVERRLAVATASACARRILIAQFMGDSGSTAGGCRGDVDRPTAFDEEVRQVMVPGENAESPRPPMAALIDVRAT